MEKARVGRPTVGEEKLGKYNTLLKKDTLDTMRYAVKAGKVLYGTSYSGRMLIESAVSDYLENNPELSEAIEKVKASEDAIKGL